MVKALKEKLSDKRLVGTLRNPLLKSHKELEPLTFCGGLPFRGPATIKQRKMCKQVLQK